MVKVLIFDWLPFLTGSCYGHKNSWLYPYTFLVEGSKVIFLLSLQIFQKFSRDRWKITIFLERKSRNQLFFNFFIAKGSYIISKPNDDFHEASFEVYYVSVSQKLGILGFSPQIFSFWPQSLLIQPEAKVWASATSMRSQILAFIWGTVCWVWMKIEASRDHYLSVGTFSPTPTPRILNRPKSPHRLGLRLLPVFDSTAGIWKNL